MNRRFLTALLGLSFGLGLLGGPAATAHAAPKKKRAKQVEVPQSAEIANAMGEIKWGASRGEVLKRFTNGIKEKYRPKIARTTDAISEDKLRAQMRDELVRIKDSVVSFNGNKTGWDVSFLKGEFTHHNGESLFVVNDDTSQNYYFFINGKLWKWFKAFNARAFQGKNFEQFAQAIQGRFGEAATREGPGKKRWLEWQNDNTRLRAIDNSQFYGFFSLVFESKDVLRRLPELRANKPAKKASHALVDSVTDGIDDESDSNQDIVDRITGKIRRRRDAPEEAAKKGRSKAPKSSPAPATDGLDSDDPLRGLL